MKRARNISLGLLAALVLAVGIVWGLARSSSPAVPLEADPQNESEAALREIFRAVGDPRELEDGQLITLRLSQAQISALAAEASAQRAQVSARAEIHEGGVDVVLSAASPYPWLSPYINLRAAMSGPSTAPVVESATLGSLPIPASLGQTVFDEGYAQIQDRDPLVAAAVEAVEGLSYEADALVVHVRWTGAIRHQLLAAGRAVAAREFDAEAVAHYADTLRANIVGEQPLPLVGLLTPLFAAVRERVSAGNDARRELESAMVIVTLYTLWFPFDDALGDAAPPALPGRELLLHERGDLPRHFLVSASAALFADRAIADALGLAKELRDADDEDGSGFSFRDLAADRAGSRLMASALSSPARLDALITRLAQPLRDDDLVPAVDEFPEGMDAAAFGAAYRDTESAAFVSLVARIDERTDACAVHRAVHRAD